MKLAKLIFVALGSTVVVLAVYAMALLRHANSHNLPVLSLDNLLGAIPMTLMGLLILAGAMLIPWNKLESRDSDQTSDDT